VEVAVSEVEAEAAAMEVLVMAPTAAGRAQSEGEQAVAKMEGWERAAADWAVAAGAAGAVGGRMRRALPP
tara:strand:- start:246 stop:455 length:210 start_codon:yes stop_codon:yes gene_type:complete